MSDGTIRLYEDEGFQAAGQGALRPGGLGLTEKAVEAAGLAPGSRILDVGCGCGKTVEYLNNVRDMKAVGIDISVEMAARARGINNTLAIMVGDAGRLPYAQDSMDGVLCECVYNLLEDGPRALGEMHRVLRPGGRLIISDLYLREKTGEFPGLPLATCINGIAFREAVVARIEAAGFRLAAWLDQTPVYKEFVAGLIMRYGSLSVFWESLVGPGEKACAIQASLRNVRIGYYLSVWGKQRRGSEPGVSRRRSGRQDLLAEGRKNGSESA